MQNVYVLFKQLSFTKLLQESQNILTAISSTKGD